MYTETRRAIHTPTEVFVDGLRRICGAFDVETRAPTLVGAARSLSKGGLEFAFVTQNATAIRRDTAQIESDPGNHFFLVWQREGTARMHQCNVSTLLNPGDMFLVDSAKPSLFQYDGRVSSQVSLHLPREETVQRFGRRVHGGLEIRRSDPLAQAMRAILTELLDGGQSHVAEAFYSVLGAYLANRSIGQVGALDPDRQILNRAFSVIAQHYTNPDFAPVHIAELTGVSLRKLQRAFSRFGTSPHKRLQDVRLNAAHNALNEKPTLAPGDISAIVFACGYRDMSTFYRQFKARFGCTPTG